MSQPQRVVDDNYTFVNGSIEIHIHLDSIYKTLVMLILSMTSDRDHLSTVVFPLNYTLGRFSFLAFMPELQSALDIFVDLCLEAEALYIRCQMLKKYYRL